LLIDKQRSISFIKKLEKYMKGFINSIRIDNNFEVDYDIANDIYLIKLKEIQILYNELIVYGRMKKDSQYLLDALMINFINYFNLDAKTLVKMKWNYIIIHKTGNGDTYYIKIPDNTGFDFKEIRGSYSYSI
jgi:hypothetical protein